MRALARRLLRDEAGQDLVEYALLTAFISFSALAAVSLILTAIGATYQSNADGMNGLWNSPSPAGGS